MDVRAHMFVFQSFEGLAEVFDPGHAPRSEVSVLKTSSLGWAVLGGMTLNKRGSLHLLSSAAPAAAAACS